MKHRDHPKPRGSFVLMKLREADSFIQAHLYESARVSINEAIAAQKAALEASTAPQESASVADFCECGRELDCVCSRCGDEECQCDPIGTTTAAKVGEKA